MNTQDFVLGVASGKYNSWFTYTCPECKSQLVHHSERKYQHPTNEENFLGFRTKRQPKINCSKAGKYFTFKPIMITGVESNE